MEENMQDEGLSLGEIFRVIFRRWLLVILITAAVTLVGILGISLIVNPMQTMYTISFSVDYPGSENLRYPDGTAFRYQDIISESNLAEVKDSSDDFANIDVRKMYEGDNISITEETDEVNGVRTPTGNYTLTAKGSYFPNGSVASAFLRGIANYPVNYINRTVSLLTYRDNLTSYGEVKTYEQKIAYLVAHRNYLVDQYESLTDIYGSVYIPSGYNKSLREFGSEVSRSFSEEDQATMENDLKINGYVFDKEYYALDTRVKIDSYTKHITDNTRIIDALRKERDALIDSISGGPGGATITDSLKSFNDQISTLIVQNSQYQNEIDRLQENLDRLENNYDEEAATRFEARLTGFYNVLSDASDTFKDVSVSIYEKESKVVFETYSASSSGGINLVIGTVVSALIGFVLSCIVVCIIDMPAYLRRKKYARAVAHGDEEENKEGNGSDKE